MRGFQGGRGVLHLTLLSMRGFLGYNVELPLLLGVSGGQEVLEELAHLFRLERDPLLAILLFWLLATKLFKARWLLHERTWGRLQGSRLYRGFCLAGGRL